MTQERPTIIYAGGGTGGHLLPGLAVAECIGRMRPELRQAFLTGRRETERKILSGFGCDLIEMTSPRAPAHVWNYPGFLARFALAYRSCKRLLRSGNVKAVVGLGGYGSVPVVMAASGRCATILMEQNVLAGRANKTLARFADAVIIAWESSRGDFRRGTEVIHLGNPVRSDIGKIERSVALAKLGLASDKQTVLVWGGSQGAHAINEAIVNALEFLAPLKERVQLVHQTGEADEAWVKTAYEKAGVKAHVAGFMHAPTAYGAADLFVGRAGATTLAEVCVVGLPMILVPYPHAAAGHQAANAVVLEAAGAAVIIEQKDLTGASLAGEITELLSDGGRCGEMSNGARGLARPTAAQDVAEFILKRIG